jgi:hypothetical protein
MPRYLKNSALLLGLAVVGLLGAASPAAATIEVDYSIDGGARTFGAASATNTVIWTQTGLGGLFDVTLSFNTSNAPGTPQLATVTGSQNQVFTTATYSGEHHLTFFISANGFTSPQSPPPTQLSVAATTLLANSVNPVVTTYTGFASTSNALFDMSQTSTPTGNYSANGQFGSGSGSALSSLFSPNGATYSLTKRLDLDITGPAGITNLSSNLQVTPTPVPAGIVMALSGMPVLGIGAWMRRRRQS